VGRVSATSSARRRFAAVPVVSKVVLLARDVQITDPSILVRLRG
jgi:hypothetical protein